MQSNLFSVVSKLRQTFFRVDTQKALQMRSRSTHFSLHFELASWLECTLRLIDCKPFVQELLCLFDIDLGDAHP